MSDTPAPPASESCPGTGALFATFVTSMGELEAELFEAQVPRTVANFVALAMGTVEWTPPPEAPSFGDLSGQKKSWTGGGGGGGFGKAEKTSRPLYSGTIFHRVIPEFMIQGGCPKGNGTGNPGWRFADEFVDGLRHEPGTLSMANSGPNTNGSQFFITEVATTHLDGRHTVFGKLTSGLDLVKQMARVRTGARDRPLEDIVLQEIRIARR